MSAVERFDHDLTAGERMIVDSLASPAKVQAFLDSIPYSTDEFYRCPLRVLRERTAHCFDGAMSPRWRCGASATRR